MIQRAEQYSPNSVEKDRAILEAVATRLRQQGHTVTMMSEDETDGGIADAQYVLTMGRRPETLARLKGLQAPVVNTPEGVENCSRSRLLAIMRATGTPLPPEEGPDGYWLKRGDGAAQTKDDVVFAPDRQTLQACISRMQQRGISDYTVSAHVRGDLVKFYGVRRRMFRYFYPTDDGQSKFGDEARNGLAHHYPFDAHDLQRQAERLAEAVGIEIYGGDCIVRADGSYCIIDFNDWPSFSRCREEAAEAIAEGIEN